MDSAEVALAECPLEVDPGVKYLLLREFYRFQMLL